MVAGIITAVLLVLFIGRMDLGLAAVATRGIRRRRAPAPD